VEIQVHMYFIYSLKSLCCCYTISLVEGQKCKAQCTSILRKGQHYEQESNTATANDSESVAVITTFGWQIIALLFTQCVANI
jgi:hypothetical protein